VCTTCVVAAEAARADEVAAAAAPASDGFDSVLERVGLLSLGLSRSGTSTESPRRLRLLGQLESSVAELEQSGFSDDELLGAWNAQIEAAWASVPPEALAARQARSMVAAERDKKKNLFERAGDMLGNAAEANLNEVLDAIGDSLPTEVDFDVAKWRLRLKKKYKKKYIPKENREDR